MEKIKEVYKAKILQDADGWWRVISGNNMDVISGKHHTRDEAVNYIKIHMDQMQEQFGPEHEVVLEMVD